MRDLKKQVYNSAITVTIFLFVGVIIFQRLEGWNAVEALYFSVTALTTVGFGDYAPTNDLSRLFASFYMLAGVAIVVSSLGMFGSEYHRYRNKIVKRLRK